MDQRPANFSCGKHNQVFDLSIKFYWNTVALIIYMVRVRSEIEITAVLQVTLKWPLAHD